MVHLHPSLSSFDSILEGKCTSPSQSNQFNIVQPYIYVPSWALMKGTLLYNLLRLEYTKIKTWWYSAARPAAIPKEQIPPVWSPHRGSLGNLHLHPWRTYMGSQSIRALLSPVPPFHTAFISDVLMQLWTQGFVEHVANFKPQCEVRVIFFSSCPTSYTQALTTRRTHLLWGTCPGRLIMVYRFFLPWCAQVKISENINLPCLALPMACCNNRGQHWFPTTVGRTLDHSGSIKCPSGFPSSMPLKAPQANAARAASAASGSRCPSVLFPPRHRANFWVLEREEALRPQHENFLSEVLLCGLQCSQTYFFNALKNNLKFWTFVLDSSTFISHRLVCPFQESVDRSRKEALAWLAWFSSSGSQCLSTAVWK